MISWLSEKIADALISGGSVDAGDRDIYVYGADVLLSTAANILCVLVIGAVAGRVLETLLFLAFFIALRSAAGGFHAATHLKCFLILLAAYGAALALILLLPQKTCGIIALPAAAVSAAAVAALAPVPHENRPASPKELVRFRKLSLWLAAGETAAVLLCFALGLGLPALAASAGMLASASSLLAAHAAGKQKKKAAGAV